MNIKAILVSFSLIVLVGCGGGGGSDSESPVQMPETTESFPPGTTESFPEVTSGYTLEQRRAHKEIINADYAKNRSITGAGVGIAVFDTGINIEHEEFGGRSINPNSRKVVSGFNKLSVEEHQYTAENQYRIFDDGGASDEGGHGTAVSSLIIGEEAGVAPSVDLLVINISSGLFFIDGAVLIGMIDEIADNGFDFASASFSGTADSFQDSSKSEFGTPEQDQKPYWDKLATRDIGLINAAGNSAQDLTVKRSEDQSIDADGSQVLAVSDPLIAPQFLYVGAITNEGKLWVNSNTPGADAEIQDRFIVAPGVNVIAASHSENDSLARWSGTSFATPIVSGAAALVKSQNPTLTNRAVLQILLDSANRIFEGYDPTLHGQGILDIQAALEFETRGLERISGG